MCQAPERDTDSPFGPSWELRPQVESPLLLWLEEESQFAGHWVSAFFAGPVVTPTEERQSAQMETNEDWLWALLNLSWNACVQGAGPLPVWNKKSSEQAGRVCLDPSPVGSAESGPGLSADEELQTGPQIPPSVSTVVGHCLISVELGFQLGNTKRCFDAVADGLQPIKTRQEKIIFFFFRKNYSWAKETSKIRIWHKQI